jgi:hypothetical protein
MEITYFTITNFDESESEFVTIDRGNGEFTSMLKSTYDAIQAEQSTPMIPGDE